MPGLRIPGRRPPREGRPRRSVNALWLFFWLILIIILLGLIFGGYRKGTPVKTGLGRPAVAAAGTRAPAPGISVFSQQRVAVSSRG